MVTSALGEPGPSLDVRIARLIEGRRAASEPPPYSTEEDAADRVVSRLAEGGLTSTFEQQDANWYCVLWIQGVGDGAKERIASGSGPTRPLAICRAFLNLPLRGSGATLHLRRSSRGWAGDIADAGSGKADREVRRHASTAKAGPEEASSPARERGAG